MGQFLSTPENIPNNAPEDVKILFQRGACTHCIGRILSIGRVEMESYRVPNIHSKDCFACHGIIDSLNPIKDAIKVALGRYNFHDIQIEIPPKVIQNDQKLLNKYNCQTSCSLKNYLKGKIMYAFSKSKEGPVLHIKINSSTDFKAELLWPPLYIVGRYFKRSRRVSNTRFMRGEAAVSSVEKELIDSLGQEIKCTERKFLSAGREDMDVRMIGSGRPFMITLLNPLPNENAEVPTSNEGFAQSFSSFIPSEIDCPNNVSATNLRITCKQPDMSPKHEKCYRCIVSCSRNVTKENLSHLDNVSNLVISQKTPCRVAHRRILAYREKTVISLNYQQICPRFFILDLKTSKGTYIKEFVNSDFGRTKPSLGELLDPENPIECQLLQLDVVFVNDA
ncbi:hypothetical protein TRFO_05771 [Tritrichomonas foetus]|uniref:tRNA pseudouridine(55) synthase n=1 Tax=Tritrichomonas foetus TaxID=1144522 RepID=A0A1J4K7J2_9EUKA|nr:hypothetical protein TRFO_05771 [Tritrichomonas foetus]|eukprot:OHT05662.1 hypothetical protein TRFO_05771 [Tritrichomonas foetus]